MTRICWGMKRVARRGVKRVAVVRRGRARRRVEVEARILRV